MFFIKKTKKNKKKKQQKRKDQKHIMALTKIYNYEFNKQSYIESKC